MNTIHTTVILMTSSPKNSVRQVVNYLFTDLYSGGEVEYQGYGPILKFWTFFTGGFGLIDQRG